MREELKWKEGREGYRDGECSTFDELPQDVPIGSFWHVVEGDLLVVRWDGIRAVNGWLNVSGANKVFIPGRGQVIGGDENEV